MSRDPHAYEFDEFRVEPRSATLWAGGRAVSVEPKVFHLLVFLIEHRDRLVEKGELLDALWPGTFVTENALTREVAKLRRALGENARSPQYIRTVHTRGYRFVGPVRVSSKDPIPAAPRDVAPEAGPPGPQPPPPPGRRPGWKSLAAIASILGVALAIGWRPSPAPSPPDVRRPLPRVVVLPFQWHDLAAATSEPRGVRLARAVSDRLREGPPLKVLALDPQVLLQPGSDLQAGIASDQQSLRWGALLQADYVIFGEVERTPASAVTHVAVLSVARRERLASADVPFVPEPGGSYEALSGAVASAVYPALHRAEVQAMLESGAVPVPAASTPPPPNKPQ